MSEYNLDLCSVLECDPRLDVINAKIISDYHGICIEHVIRDIKAERKNLKLGLH